MCCCLTLQPYKEDLEKQRRNSQQLRYLKLSPQSHSRVYPLSLSPIGVQAQSGPLSALSIMKSTATLAFLAAFGCVRAADDNTIGFGPYFSLGPTASWIRSAKTTLVLPKVPSPATDRLALWPGMGTSGNDLIQALAVSFSDPKANCGAVAGQWCVWASTLQDGTQLGGTQVPANAGDQITMSCMKSPAVPLSEPPFPR